MTGPGVPAGISPPMCCMGGLFHEAAEAAPSEAQHKLRAAEAKLSEAQQAISQLSKSWDIIKADCDERGEQVAQLQASKGTAYSERDALVCALSKMFPARLERHPDSDATWDDDWRWIVFCDLPTGQASWHINDSELDWFAHLERHLGVNSWDGHTPAEKYARVARLEAIQNLAPVAELEATISTLARALELFVKYAPLSGDIALMIRATQPGGDEAHERADKLIEFYEHLNEAQQGPCGPGQRPMTRIPRTRRLP